MPGSIVQHMLEAGVAGEGDDANVPGGGRCDEPVGIERREQVVPHAPRKRRRGPPRQRELEFGG